MKILEVIRELKKRHDLYGNAEVVFRDSEGEFAEDLNIMSVYFDEDANRAIVSDFPDFEDNSVITPSKSTQLLLLVCKRNYDQVKFDSVKDAVRAAIAEITGYETFCIDDKSIYYWLCQAIDEVDEIRIYKQVLDAVGGRNDKSIIDELISQIALIRVRDKDKVLIEFIDYPAGYKFGEE